MMTASLVRVTRSRKELEAWQQLSRVTTAKVKMIGKSFRSPIILLSSDCVIRIGNIQFEHLNWNKTGK